MNLTVITALLHKDLLLMVLHQVLLMDVYMGIWNEV